MSVRRGQELWSVEKSERRSYALRITRARQFAVKIGQPFADDVPLDISQALSEWERGCRPSEGLLSKIETYIAEINAPLEHYRAERRAAQWAIQLERRALKLQQKRLITKPRYRAPNKSKAKTVDLSALD